MSRFSRPALTAAAMLILLLGGIVAAIDLSSGTTTCGSALLPRDAAGSVVRSGDPSIDDFTQQSTVDQCARLVLRQRLLAGGCFVVGIGLLVARRSQRDPEPVMPGDPIV